MIWRRKLLDFVTAVESEGALVSMLLMETILDASYWYFGTNFRTKEWALSVIDQCLLGVFGAKWSCRWEHGSKN